MIIDFFVVFLYIVLFYIQIPWAYCEGFGTDVVINATVLYYLDESQLGRASNYLNIG